ncbi:hypothetical protein PV10_02937 [Exophiala mesophila]|uniref:Major facilitator superfamily (MFS) profile domain-containing protein n=1 Tax=Exophiala mesophila TaxID=212818 RepID=A0A0D1ZMQ5_EXOME|nr:uncharacterized protein PV10_02937 [Exophiala mesophila]KIV95264.1 hypothetical protein PV10_02937 [Exophiala mesophila]
MEKTQDGEPAKTQGEDIKIDVASVEEVFVDPVIEKRARFKFDCIVLPVIAICMLMAGLDRSNIGNARVMGFDADLGLVGTQFNTISVVFYPLYLVMEVPWTMAIHKYGYNRIIAIMTTGWGSITLGFGFVKTYEQAVALRVLLGLFEAGMISGLVLVISTIWAPHQQAKRIGVLYVIGALTGAFGGLIAYAIQTMGYRSGMEPWRWLFIIEGIISCIVAIIVFFAMPLNPEEAWFLNKEEKETMAARKRRDVVYRGKKTFSWPAIRATIIDPTVYLTAIVQFSHGAATLGFSIFLPTIIRGMGYTNLQANYLTVPVYCTGAISVILFSTIADKFQRRAILIVAAMVPPVIGYSIIIGSANKAAGYAAMFIVVTGLFCVVSVLITWTSMNLAPDEKRAFALPFIFTFGGVSGALASFLYRTDDAPRYVQGNSISLGLEAVALVSVGLLYLLRHMRNSKKEKLRAQGVTDNSKYGDEAMDFEYKF